MEEVSLPDLGQRVSSHQKRLNLRNRLCDVGWKLYQQIVGKVEQFQVVEPSECSGVKSGDGAVAQSGGL